MDITQHQSAAVNNLGGNRPVQYQQALNTIHRQAGECTQITYFDMGGRCASVKKTFKPALYQKQSLWEFTYVANILTYAKDRCALKCINKNKTQSELCSGGVVAGCCCFSLAIVLIGFWML